MAENRPVQHKPKHLEEGAVFDPRHPAASAFAPAQPAAGVVADDVPERGQNLRGGSAARDAAGEYGDQREVLAAEREDKLRRASGSPGPVKVEDGQAKPAEGGQRGGDGGGEPKGSTGGGAKKAATGGDSK